MASSFLRLRSRLPQSLYDRKAIDGNRRS